MAKLRDYDYTKRVEREVVQFKDDIRELVNFGKYQFQVLVSTTAPVFAGHAGEVVFWRNGTDGRMYVYIGSSWNLTLLWTADASALS